MPTMKVKIRRCPALKPGLSAPNRKDRKMKTRLLLRSTLPIVLLLSICSLAVGQQTLSAYLTSRVTFTAKARIDQTDPTRQAAPPAATGNSTSLVERSSAPDILGLGLDFLNLSDATGSKKSVGTKTFTFSAYALKTRLTGLDPLDPEVYNKYHNWRRVSFTVGFDTPENTTEKDPVVGIKLLVINGRDLSSHNDKEFAAVQNALNGAAQGFSRIRTEVKQYLLDTLQASGKLPAGVTTMEDLEGILGSTTEFPQLLSSLS